MSYKFYTVDRIEEDIAVLYDDNDIKSDVPVSELPPNIKESDILRFYEETKTYIIDEEKTKETKADIKERFKSLFKKKIKEQTEDIKPKKPFVISVAAQSGGGKTTVVAALKERLTNSAVIYFDDYGDAVYLDRDINDWSADKHDDNEWHTEPIAADIERLLNDPYDYIIIDYPFGYLNNCVGKYINLTVFIDTPLDVALARRIIRDYTSRSTESDFGLADVEELSLAGLDKELRFYLTRSRPTYAKMPEMQKPASDFIVDGLKSPKEIAEEIIIFIEKNTKNI